MKFSILRAAAHNIADSFANEISFLAGCYNAPSIWKDVEAQPTKELRFDLLDATQDSSIFSNETMRFLERMREVVPGQLQREGCDPALVAKFWITLRKNLIEPITGREVLVTIAGVDGRETTDRYVGNPLRRLQGIDSIGRRRRLRHPVKD